MTIDQIKTQLKASIDVLSIEVIDDSHLHRGHYEAPVNGGSHFTVKIISPSFEGKSRVARHRMIYEALSKEFNQGLHALVIKAFTPMEVVAK